MAVKYFGIPFATSGDRAAVPDATQPDGSVSYTQGYTPDYELINTDPDYKPIERTKYNGVLHDITDAIGEIQSLGAPLFTVDAQPYPINAIVRHDDIVWVSNINTNNSEPGADLNWRRSGGTKTVSVITSSNPTWTPQVSTRTIEIVAVGGGGGGGGVDGQGDSTGASSSGGGGGGAVMLTTDTIDSSYNITIGAGGLGGGGSGLGVVNGGDGGDTTVVSDNVNINASGGTGGAGFLGVSGTGRSTRAVGGLATGGDLNIPGGDSNVAAVVTGDVVTISSGGTSYLANSVSPAGVNEVGTNASNYGGGGSGSTAENTTADRKGGDGFQGVVIITEYS